MTIKTLLGGAALVALEASVLLVRIVAIGKCRPLAALLVWWMGYSLGWIK